MSTDESTNAPDRPRADDPRVIPDAAARRPGRRDGRPGEDAVAAWARLAARRRALRLAVEEHVGRRRAREARVDAEVAD